MGWDAKAGAPAKGSRGPSEHVPHALMWVPWSHAGHWRLTATTTSQPHISCWRRGCCGRSRRSRATASASSTTWPRRYRAGEPSCYPLSHISLMPPQVPSAGSRPIPCPLSCRSLHDARLGTNTSIPPLFQDQLIGHVRPYGQHWWPLALYRGARWPRRRVPAASPAHRRGHRWPAAPPDPAEGPRC